MKILQVVPYFYPAWSYGGTPRVVYELSISLARRGHEVTVYTTDAYDGETRLRGVGACRSHRPACACPHADRSVSTGKRLVDGIEVFYFPNLSNRLAYNQKIFLSPAMLPAIKREISNFDVVHLHEFRTLQNVMVYRCAKSRNIPYLLSAHGSVLRIMGKLRLKQVFDRLVGFRILGEASRLIATSRSEAQQYRQMGVCEERISIVPNGIDVEEFARLPLYGGFRKRYKLLDKKVILFLGRISRIKGVDFLMKAFARIANERDDAVLVIVGSDEGYKKELPVTDHRSRVIFTGLLTESDKLSALVDADVLVYPSIFEVFGLVPFEALMCNTPVIVTDDCGCGEIIGGAKAGHLVKYGDVKELKDKIIGVLDNPERAKKMVHNGKEFVYNNLSWNRIANEMVEVYQEVVGGAHAEKDRKTLKREPSA